MPCVIPARFLLLILALVVALPLAGGLSTGRPLAAFTQFPPPLEIPTDYVRFSWLALGAIAVLLAAITFSWLAPRPASASPREDVALPAPPLPRKFPSWGWAALTWTLAWWTLAWTRWAWFEPLQSYTFFPLWLGFIVTMNAATEGRGVACLMRRAPGRWLMLFAASAACWWTFEWLNRFVQNWHYLNVEQVGALEYVVHATACFSTVLPAIAAIAEWLTSSRSWNAAVGRGPAWGWLTRREVAVALAIFGCASLFFTGVRPQWFYPALWVSPLALQLAVPVLSGRRSLGDEMARGDWRSPATWMIAALICGFFWELWNWQSLAKWIYTVPGVDRWHLFEMPALGYVGYLPFGLQCLLVTEGVIGGCWRSVQNGGKA